MFLNFEIVLAVLNFVIEFVDNMLLSFVDKLLLINKKTQLLINLVDKHSNTC
jgi:hypothetical protein